MLTFRFHLVFTYTLIHILIHISREFTRQFVILQSFLLYTLSSSITALSIWELPGAPHSRHLFSINHVHQFFLAIHGVAAPLPSWHKPPHRPPYQSGVGSPYLAPAQPG